MVSSVVFEVEMLARHTLEQPAVVLAAAAVVLAAAAVVEFEVVEVEAEIAVVEDGDAEMLQTEGAIAAGIE